MTITQDNAAAQARYTQVAMWLHWLIALAILYNLTSGLMRPLLPRGFFVLHVSSGITILALTVLRVAWRLTHKPPPLLPMKTWEAHLAHTVHFLLYCAMVALPLSGWLMVSARPPEGSPGAAFAQAQSAARWAAARPASPAPGSKASPPKPRGPTMVWGVVKLPMITPINEIGRNPDGVSRQHELHERIEMVHGYGGWALLALLLVHIAGGLKHQFVDRQREYARMGLGRRGRFPAR